jgi:hypothetical protein
MFSTFFTITIAAIFLFMLSSIVCCCYIQDPPPMALSLLFGFLGVVSIGMTVTSYIIFMINY